jgi:hypothetical protein
MFSLFAQKPAAPAPAAPNAQQGQQGQPTQQQANNTQNQPTGNPGSTPGSTGSNGANGGNEGNNSPVNPMDAYGKMFDNTGLQADKPPSFSIAPDVMDKVVGQQDFTKGINPELFQKVLQGDSNAFMEVLNSVGRNAYRSSIEHGGMLTDQFVSAREGHSNKGFSSKVKQELTTNALSGTPNFQHPVVRKQLTEIATRMSQLHPDASPQEIADLSKQYLTDLSSVINPPADTKAQEASKETDWDKYFS